jgi:hypothetical protein
MDPEIRRCGNRIIGPVPNDTVLFKHGHDFFKKDGVLFKSHSSFISIIVPVPTYLNHAP